MNGGAGDEPEIPVEYRFFWRKESGVPCKGTYNKNEKAVNNMGNRCIK